MLHVHISHVVTLMGSINVNNSNKSGDFCGFKLPTSCVFTPGLKWWMILCERDVRVCDIAHHVFLAGEVESVGKRSSAPYIDIAR